MTNPDLTVGTAQRMYNCRNTLKSQWGNEYNFKISSYVTAIKRVMDSNGLTEYESVVKIVSNPEIEYNERSVMMLMAAAIEINEEK